MTSSWFLFFSCHNDARYNKHQILLLFALHLEGAYKTQMTKSIRTSIWQYMGSIRKMLVPILCQKNLVRTVMRVHIRSILILSPIM